ncbi:MAG: heme A synthase, partial [Chitinophagaceae bacterium]
TQTVHFIHRGLAYALLIMIILFFVKTKKSALKTRYLSNAVTIVLSLVLLQAVLGIISVLISPGIIPGKWGAFEWMAQLHQVVGMLLTLGMVATWYLSTGKTFNRNL